MNLPKRTEEEILASQFGYPGEGGEEVKLGGRTYKIRPIKGRAHSRWFRQQVGPVIESLQGVAPLIQMVVDKVPGESSTLGFEHLESLVDLFKQIAGPQFDVLLDTVYRFCPEIGDDRNFLEGYVTSEEGLVLDENGTALEKDVCGEFIGEPAMSGEGATDEEFLQAFFMVLRMVYGPFVQMLGLQMTSPTEKTTTKESLGE